MVTVFIEAKRDREASLRQALMAHARNCLGNEPGCKRYDVALDPVDGTAFFLYQLYESEAAYLAHREFPHYAEFQLKVDPWTQVRRVLTYQLLAAEDMA